MSDDRITGRRAKVFIEGDAARATKRPQSATPIEIDSEVTPPPMEPPDPSTLDGFDRLAPELQRQLIAFWNTQREHDVALVKLWDARHVRDDVVALHNLIAAIDSRLNRLGNLPLLMTQQSAVLTQLLAWKETREKLDSKLERSLDTLNGRLGDVEKQHIELRGSIAALGKELNGYASGATKGFEEVQKTIGEMQARVRSLEDDRIKYKAKAGGVAATISAFVAIVAWLISRVWK